MTDILEFLKNNPDYIDTLKSIVEFEEESDKEGNPLIEDKPYDSYWSCREAQVNGARVHKLTTEGIVESVYNSNNHSDYALSDREEVKQALDKIDSMMDSGVRVIEHEYPDEDDLPDDLFSNIVGYEDIKFLFKRALTTDDITNLLLIGPPGSGKSMFLRAIRDYNDISNTEYIDGGKTTSAGFTDKMFNCEPMVMLIDEIDDMDDDDQSALQSYSETGIVEETKYNKDRQMEINTSTFAAGNEDSNIRDTLDDERLTKLELDRYTRDEFTEVCRRMLTSEHDITVEEAEKIADAVWNQVGYGNVRRAKQVARLSRGDPERVLSVLDNY
jgi:hypothetical protein